MLKIFKIAYLTNRRVRLATWGMLPTTSILFFWLTGGMPPRGWRILAQAMAQFPTLWAMRGPEVLLPLFALVAYSFTLLFVWCCLLLAIAWVMIQQWFYLQTWRRIEQFARSVQHADAGTSPIPSSPSPDLTPPPLFSTIAMPTTTMQARPLSPKASAQTTGKSRRTVNLHPPLAPALEEAIRHQAPPDTDATRPIGVTSATSIATRAGVSEQGMGIGTMDTGHGPVAQPLRVTLPTTDPLRPTRDNLTTLRIGTALDPGITRKLKPNEDHLLAVHGNHTYNNDYRPYGLFVVADGMGGHTNGQEASRLAIQHIRNAIIPTLLSNVDLDEKHSKELLLEGVQHANLAIHQQNRQHESDMGSTITAAILIGTLLCIANVGDSRTYRYNEREGLTQVSRDHSVVARMVAAGVLSAEEVYTHPQRNQIYRCLGETASVQIDTFSLSFQPGDTLLLCSDGLWEMVRDTRIQEILHATLPDATQASQALLQAALAGGGKDNISVIVAHRV